MHRPPEWRSSLRHCITVLAVSLQILIQFQAVSQPAWTWRPMRWCTICPAPSGLGEGLIARDVLVSSRSNDFCGGPGSSTLTWSPGVRCFFWHIGAAGFRGHCVKKQCGLVGSCFGGRKALDLRLSRVRIGVAAMWQNCNYQLGYLEIGVQK